MKRTWLWVTVLMMPIVLSACGFSEGKAEAQKVAQSLFEERIACCDFGSEAYYSDIFWKNTDADQWRKIKVLVDKAMGPLKSYSLKDWNIKTTINTNQLSGTIVVLVYETTYAKGKGVETLTLHKPLLGKHFKIVGHHFNSKRIQELINQGIDQVALKDSV